MACGLGTILLCGSDVRLFSRHEGNRILFRADDFCVLTYRLVGEKKALIKVVLSGLGYMLAMGLAYLVSNPLLIYSGISQKYFEVLSEQFNVLSSGYGVVYEVGLISSWPSVLEYYGHWVFLLSILGVCIWGVIRGPNRLLQTIIITWMIPISILVFGFIHFKYQYWLPVILPMFSTLAVILPDKIEVRGLFTMKNNDSWAKRLLAGLVLSVVAVQFTSYVYSDAVWFNQRVHAAENSYAILFYNQALEALEPLPSGSYYVYHDVRMYVPETDGWVTEAIFELLDYDYLQQRNFDVVMLMQQRINDYLNPEVVGIDSEAFTRSQVFYKDANNGNLKGYHLVFRNDFGLIFVKDELYEANYVPPQKSVSHKYNQLVTSDRLSLQQSQ